MEEHIRQALEIVKAQAGFRTMTEEEICAMVQGLSVAIYRMTSGTDNIDGGQSTERALTERAPRDNAIVCLECHNAFKMLTRKHMMSHGLTPAEYREKWGYPKGAPLVCKALQRQRRKKMKDMKLWEKRRKVKD